MSKMLKAFKCLGVHVSANVKTGLSLNVGRSTCVDVRTPWCQDHCYGQFRHRGKQRRCAMGCTCGNSTPMTNRLMHEAYERNVDLIEAIDRATELDKLAEGISAGVKKTGLDNLRICGLGELFSALTRLVVRIEKYGIHCWGFSRSAEQLDYMLSLVTLFCLPSRPTFHGSIDPSTTKYEADHILASAKRLCPITSPALAYATCSCPIVAKYEVMHHTYSTQMAVVFGFHAGSKHTHLRDAVGDLACPATEGEGISCQECRRCIGGK